MPLKRKYTVDASDTENGAKILKLTGEQALMCDAWAEKLTNAKLVEKVVRNIDLFGSASNRGRLFRFPNMPFLTPDGDVAGLNDGETLGTYTTADDVMYAFTTYFGKDEQFVVKPYNYWSDGQMIFLPCCAIADGKYYHYLLPLLQVLAQFVSMPPLVNLEELYEVADAFTPALYKSLALRYADRCIRKLDEVVVVNKKTKKKDVVFVTKVEPEQFGFGTYAYGDAVDNQVTYFEALTGRVDQHSAVVTGLQHMCTALNMPVDHAYCRLVKMHMALVAPPPMAAAVPVEPAVPAMVAPVVVPRESREVQTCAELVVTPPPAPEPPAPEPPVSEPPVSEPVAVCKKELLEQVELLMRDEKPDVAFFIRTFLLTVDEPTVVAQWESRCAALKQMMDCTRQDLDTFSQVHFNQLLESDVLKMALTTQAVETVNEWDHDTLKSKFLALKREYEKLSADIRFCRDLHTRVLAYQELKKPVVAMEPAAQPTVVQKAWFGLRTALMSVSDLIDDTDQDTPLYAVRQVARLFQNAYELALQPDTTQETVAQKLLLGQGPNALRLTALDLDNRMTFETPLKTFFETMQVIKIDADFVDPQRFLVDDVKEMHCARVDQLLLLAAGKPFLKYGLFDTDGTRIYFRSELNVNRKLLATVFDEDDEDAERRRIVPEFGYEGYEKSLAEAMAL